MALYIDNLDRFKDYLITIKCGAANSGIREIQGVILDDSFTLENSAEFSNADVRMGSDVAMGALTKLSEKLAGGVLSSTIKKKFNSVIQSAEDWQGGSSLEFSVNFNVFRNSKGQVSSTKSFKEFYSNLVKLTQAKNGSGDGVFAPQISHYDSFTEGEFSDKLKGIIKAKENNMFTVTIGKWFKARRLMPVSTNMVLSTYTDTTKQPIFATVTIRFKSYRILTSGEWGSIIKEPR